MSIIMPVHVGSQYNFTYCLTLSHVADEDHNIHKEGKSAQVSIVFCILACGILTLLVPQCVIQWDDCEQAPHSC